MKFPPLLQSLVAALTTSISFVSAASNRSTAISNITGGSVDAANAVGGYKSVAYFTSWSIFGRKYNMWDVPASKLTHVLYAFANVGSEGRVFYADTYADVSKFFAGHDTGYDGDGHLHGNVNQLWKLKQSNRNLKGLLSIGGWSYSQGENKGHFPDAARFPSSRARFAATALELMKDGGFDGIDIDWEFPQNEEEGNNFVLLLGALRKALDQYSAQHAKGHHFLITVASPAAADIYSHMPLAKMDKYLDFWNVMTYDFSGSWGQKAGHQANLYPSATNPESTPHAINSTIAGYMACGVPAHKLVMGVPVYSHAFSGTDGPSNSFNAPKIANPAVHCWEAGVCDYKALPMAGAHETYDPELGASYSYDPLRQEFMSYDNPDVVRQKGEYIKQQGLGGAVFWEISADKAGSDSLIWTMVDTLGYRLEKSENWLEYPDSRYENVRNGTPSL